MASKALKLVNGVARMVEVGVEVRDEGGTVLSEATALDFTGSAVTAIDAGSGVANISVSGGAGGASIYDEVIIAPVGGYAINDIITLPSSGEYEAKDLKVFLDGTFWEEGIDYDYVGVNPRTQIQLKRIVSESEKLRFRVEGIAAAIYDEPVVVPNGGYSAGTNITLPSSKTYADSDLKVYLDGNFLEPLIDYNYVGPATGNRTQIQLVVDLFEGERLRFRIE